MAVKRITHNLAKRIRSGEILYFDIPHIGLFVSKKNVVGVQFNDYLIADTKVPFTRNFLTYKFIDDSEQNPSIAPQNK